MLGRNKQGCDKEQEGEPQWMGGVGQAEPSEEVSFGQSLEEEKEPALCTYRGRAPVKRRAPRRVPAKTME